MPLNFGSDDLSECLQGNVRRLLDPADKISRHRLGKPSPAHQDPNAPRRPRKEDGGLTGGISPSHDDDVLIATELRFHRSCRVIDADAFEPFHADRIELAILYAASDHYRPSLHHCAIGQFRHVRQSLAVKLCYRTRDGDFGSKALLRATAVRGGIVRWRSGRLGR